MKQCLSVAPWLLFLASCSSSNSTQSCAGTNTGVWSGLTVSDQVTFSADCSFDYVGVDDCLSTGRSFSPLGPSGTVQLEIESSTEGLCLPAGSYTCAYLITNEVVLTFDCGAGALSYSKNP